MERIRSELKLRKNEMAARLDVTEGYMAQILRGDRDVRLSMIYRIAKEFDIEPDALLRRKANFVVPYVSNSQVKRVFGQSPQTSAAKGLREMRKPLAAMDVDGLNALIEWMLETIVDRMQTPEAKQAATEFKNTTTRILAAEL